MVALAPGNADREDGGRLLSRRARRLPEAEAGSPGSGRFPGLIRLLAALSLQRVTQVLSWRLQM